MRKIGIVNGCSKAVLRSCQEICDENCQHDERQTDQDHFPETGERSSQQKTCAHFLRLAGDHALKHEEKQRCCNCQREGEYHLHKTSLPYRQKEVESCQQQSVNSCE